MIVLISTLVWAASLPAQEPPQKSHYLHKMKLLHADFPPVSLKTHRPGSYRANFSIEGVPVEVDLKPHRVRSPQFKVYTIDGQGNRKEVSLPPETTYRGSPAGRPDVQVAASICDEKLTALIKDGDNRFWAIEPAVADAPGNYVVYRAQDVDIPPGTCEIRHAPPRAAAAGSSPETQTADDGAPPPLAAAAAGTSIAEIAFDTDYEFFTLNSSSVAATVADIENVMNGVNLIYENDVQITYDIVSINVRTNSGTPYTSTDPYVLLDQMEETWKADFVGVSRDIAHLMTGKSLDAATVGLAYMGAVCDDPGEWGYGYGLSRSRFSGNYQSRVSLTAHELGHNWNAGHDPSGNIMCGSVGGCSGIQDRFAAPAINSILTFKATLSCLGVVPPPPPPDQDSDGIPDDWEIRYYSNPTNAVPDSDDDGDGVDNFDEYISDTNPTSAVSFLQFLIEPQPGSGVALSYQSSTGRVYSVFCTTNPASTNWVQLQTNEPGLGTTRVILPDTTSHCSFYHLEAGLP